MVGSCHSQLASYSLHNWQAENDVLVCVFINDGGFVTCASPHSRGLNGTWRPPEGGFLGSFRGRHNAGRVQMSRGTACCKIHQKYPPGGHGVPEITKSDFKSEIKTYSIPYTHQGVSGGSRKYFWSAPLQVRSNNVIRNPIPFPIRSYVRMTLLAHIAISILGLVEYYVRAYC